MAGPPAYHFSFPFFKISGTEVDGSLGKHLAIEHIQRYITMSGTTIHAMDLVNQTSEFSNLQYLKRCLSVKKWGTTSLKLEKPLRCGGFLEKLLYFP